VTPLTVKIRARIESEGPILFSEFMRLALYDERHGYYRGQPFGRNGDFYTAAQLQPVFGAYVRLLAEAMLPGYANFVDIGAGQEDLRQELRDKPYFAVQAGQEIPKTQNSVLFANEFFDALPVDIESEGRDLRVTWQDGVGFAWWPAAPVSGLRERRSALRMELERLFAATQSPAALIAIDYGYTERTRLKFPSGTLMAYRAHIAHENVLADPGTQDITAHVDWEDFFAQANEVGWSFVSFETMDRSLMSLGEEAMERLRAPGVLQLKQLLFELGPRFDVAVLRK
jgi:NADH dehydrogenase [ubiquinone] 1 alpha subcomplex assembly factor 7